MPKRSSRWASCGYALTAVTITPPAIFADAANVAGSRSAPPAPSRLYRSVLLDGVSYARTAASIRSVQEAARRGAQTIVVIRVLRGCFIPRSSSSGWSAGWERVVCNRWSIWCIITKPPTAPSSSSSRNRRVSCGSSKSPQRPPRSAARRPTTALLEDHKTGRQCGRYFAGNGG